ncbi:MAG: carbohydrate-binding protein [Spirochaetota bacterium]
MNPAGPFGDPQPIVGAHGGAIVPETLNPSLPNEAEHGFHEGTSVRKRNGVYYLVYADISRGRPTALGYATADSPLGPYTKRGIIVDNTGCDPETWNNHGSIAEVPMTTGGVEGPLSARRFMDASRACLVRGGLYAAPIRSPELPGDASTLAARSEPPYEVLSRISSDSAACYRFSDFDDETRFSCLASSATYGGTVEIRVDAPDGDLLGSCDVPRTGDWTRFVRVDCEVRPVSGVHELWLVFRTGHGRSPGRLVDVLGFWFA